MRTILIERKNNSLLVKKMYLEFRKGLMPLAESFFIENIACFMMIFKLFDADELFNKKADILTVTYSVEEDETLKLVGTDSSLRIRGKAPSHYSNDFVSLIEQNSMSPEEVWAYAYRFLYQDFMMHEEIIFHQEEKSIKINKLPTLIRMKYIKSIILQKGS